MSTEPLLPCLDAASLSLITRPQTNGGLKKSQSEITTTSASQTRRDHLKSSMLWKHVGLCFFTLAYEWCLLLHSRQRIFQQVIVDHPHVVSPLFTRQLLVPLGESRAQSRYSHWYVLVSYISFATLLQLVNRSSLALPIIRTTLLLARSIPTRP